MAVNVIGTQCEVVAVVMVVMVDVVAVIVTFEVVAVRTSSLWPTAKQVDIGRRYCHFACLLIVGTHENSFMPLCHYATKL